MAKTKILFECTACGHESPKWLGQCPSCSAWHTFEEQRITPEPKAGRHTLPSGRQGVSQKVIPISEVSSTDSDRMSTGFTEVDRVLGGGLVKGSLVLLGGDPGIGKSTLTLQMARHRPEVDILYVAGEESPHQIRQRADRIGASASALRIWNGTEVSAIVDTVLAARPELLIIDSIQTVYRSELSSLPGSVQQLRECAAVFQQLAKQEQITTLLIGHVTKQGDIAGPMLLEHMVDTVLQFEGDSNQMYRMIRAHKNRFGPAHEVGVFEMTGDGLEQVTQPSRFFLSDPDETISGRAVTCVMEGSRPMLMEVQALVAPATYATPQRTASGVDQRRVSLLLAVLEKRAGVSFAGKDVYVNVAGGFKLSDPAADSALAAALVSSLWDLPLPLGTVLVGEMGLGGDIRAVPFLTQRLQESSRMGFEAVFHGRTASRENASNAPARLSVDGVDPKQVKSVTELLQGLFSR